MGQVYIWETNASEPLMNASRALQDVETIIVGMLWDKSDGYLFTGQVTSGVKVA